MQLKNGCMAVKLMEFVGLCGEVPVSLVRKLPGYYDYNRRLVTRLVQEGYLKERRMKGYRRRIVRSLSLTEAGLCQLQRVSPGWAQRIRAHLLAPENGHGNWKKTLRLHRGEQDGTRIWILPPEQFPEWLKSYPECWKSTTENM